MSYSNDFSLNKKCPYVINNHKRKRRDQRWRCPEQKKAVSILQKLRIKKTLRKSQPDKSQAFTIMNKHSS